MKQAKFLGHIIDGAWLVESRSETPTRSGVYRLVNIYNKRVIEIAATCLNRVAKGETSISKIMAQRIRLERHQRRNCYYFHEKNVLLNN